MEYTVVWTRHREYGVLDGYGVTGCGYSVTNLTHGVTRADPYTQAGVLSKFKVLWHIRSLGNMLIKHSLFYTLVYL